MSSSTKSFSMDVYRDIPPKCSKCPNQACPRASWTLSLDATTDEKYHSLCHDCRETNRIATVKGYVLNGES